MRMEFGVLQFFGRPERDGEVGKVCRCDPGAGGCTDALACDDKALRCLPPDLDAVV